MSKFGSYAGFNITSDLLSQICVNASIDRLQIIAPMLENLFYKFQVRHREQIAMFVAQIAHESAEFQYTQELGDIAYFTDNYEDRADLGNTQYGDGYKYRGRGFLQITGRANYAAFQTYLAKVNVIVDLLNHPELVANDLNLALLSAFWYFNTRNLWGLALSQNLEATTRIINGGLNGLSDRRLLFDRACNAFGC